MAFRSSRIYLFAAEAIIFPITGYAASGTTATPVKYVVVIFGENNSFDHYFGAYPNAKYPQGAPPSSALPAGESPFSPLSNTPSVNGLTPFLLQTNPNGINPFRLDRSMAFTCDNNNGYTAEQKAYNLGLVNAFRNTTATGPDCTPNLSMGYYDGNTLTALWNYAQYFAMSDSFFDTEFGTTVMGHLNLISGQTHQTNVQTIAGKVANGSVIANVEAGYDDCVSSATSTPLKRRSMS